MPLRAIARLIQTMLYAKRFFPYYVYNILGGIEEDGSSFPPPSSQYRNPHSTCQELALSTLLILSGHMNARLAELPVLPNPSFSLSSMARQVNFVRLSAPISFPVPFASPTFPSRLPSGYMCLHA
jgi:hypothetical protein